jgi:hypothetical protein
MLICQRRRLLGDRPGGGQADPPLRQRTQRLRKSFDQRHRIDDPAGGGTRSKSVTDTAVYPAISRICAACAQAITFSQPPMRSNQSHDDPPPVTLRMSPSSPSGR